MTRKNADLVKASMDAEVPQFGPFVVHDFQEYAQGKANESNDLVKKLSGKLETNDAKLTETKPSPAQLEWAHAIICKAAGKDLMVQSVRDLDGPSIEVITLDGSWIISPGPGYLLNVVSPGGETRQVEAKKLTETRPSPEQLEAIEAYRLKHGSNWKEKLSDAWASGRDDREPNGHLLRQVRNNFGPEWLEEYQSAPRVRAVISKHNNGIQIQEVTLPAAWASGLVNGDWSGLTYEDPAEAAKAQEWLRESGLSVLSCSDERSTERLDGILTEVLTYSCAEPGSRAAPVNTDPDNNGYVVLTIDNTENAAFVDLGRDQEISRIIGEAAGKFEDEESRHGGNFVLRDVNGNRVGEVKRVDELSAEKADEGTVRLSIGLGNAAFSDDDTGVEIAHILRDAAKQVRDGNHSFPTRDSNGNSVGEFKFSEPKTLDADASDDDYAPS